MYFGVGFYLCAYSEYVIMIILHTYIILFHIWPLSGQALQQEWAVTDEAWGSIPR